MRLRAAIAAALLLFAVPAFAQNVAEVGGSVGGVGSISLGAVSINQPINPGTINAAAPGTCPTSPQQFEIADTTAGPLCLQIPFSAISGTASNSQLAGPLVNGVTIGAGGDFSLTKSDPLAVGNETLTPGNVNVTHLSSPLPVAQGGTGTATPTGVSAGTGISVSGSFPTQTVSSNSVSTACWFSPFAVNAGAFWGNYTPSKNLHIKSVSIDSSANATGCTTAAVLEVTVNGVAQAASAVTLVNGTSDWHLAGLNIAAPSGQQIGAGTTTNAAGCSSTPTNINYCVEYSAD